MYPQQNDERPTSDFLTQRQKQASTLFRGAKMSRPEQLLTRCRLLLLLVGRKCDVTSPNTA